MKLFCITLSFALILSCQQQETIKLTSIFDVNQIDQVKIERGSETYYLSTKQIKQFRSDMEKLTLVEGLSPQSGEFNITIKIKEKEFQLTTSSNGQFIGFPASILSSEILLKKGNATLCFKTNGIDFEKYKNETIGPFRITNFSPNWLTGIWCNVYDSNASNFRILAFTNDTIYSPNEEDIQICLNDFYRTYNYKSASTDSTYLTTYTNDSEQISYEFKRTKESFSTDSILTYAIMKNGKRYREHSQSINLTFKRSN